MTFNPDTNVGFGWKRDLPDWRDYKLAAWLPEQVQVVPRYANLVGTKRLPPIWSQGKLGSCTAHAGGAAWCYDRARQSLPFVQPSRLFLYYNERAIEGSTGHDSGASIRDCLKSMVRTGVCNETLWPYEITRFTNKPASNCYADAHKHVGVEYAQVAQDLDQLKACIAGGFPFVFGFSVYQSFMTAEVARTGLVPMPSMRDRSVGGHAVAAVGYNSRNYFLCRNSWGTEFGDPDYPGHFWLPGAYIGNAQLAADFWVLRTVSG